MNTKRIAAFAMALVMVIAIAPLSSFAEGITSSAVEAHKLGLLDDVWAELDAVEAEALASGADKSAVTLAVYNAAMQNGLVDEASFNSLTDKSFFFTVDGMACAYDYTARNFKKASYTVAEDKLVEITGTRNAPTNNNVLLVGPYYGHDTSFTDQYRQEASSIAQVTGGQVTILQSTGATGPAIANACPYAGVVIFDSHGTHSGNSSYLCLTTSSGITSQDYSNGWAVNAGSAAYIDGRYIQNHAPADLPNNFFWMAICEGMMLQGHGTTGNALIAKGAAAVYGYSQSVTFAGDYEYEATFWDMMKYEEATVAEALDVMKEEHGIPDPYGDAYPVLMSPVDPFPANPDGPQEVNCDWTLLPVTPVELESYSLSETAVDVYETLTVTVTFERVPDNANQYQLVWHSSDEDVVSVDGNNRKVKITGVSEGATSIYCEVFVDGVSIGTASCDVNVLHLPTVNEAANVPGGTLEFTCPTTNYPWQVAMLDGELAARSGNQKVGNSTSSIQTVIDMQAGETLSFRWRVSSEEEYDFYYFYVNNSQVGQALSGETEWLDVTYTAQTSGTYTFRWSFVKDPYVEDGYDGGFLADVCYSGGTVLIPGDMDGDGEIDMNDTLEILRIILGLVENTQGVNIDMDGNGTVDINDALMALRIAMGLIN